MNGNEMTELLEMSRNSLQGIIRMSEQMGLVNSRLGVLESKTASIESRMEAYEDSIRVSRSQADAIKRAIHAKVCDVLEIKYTKDGVATSDSIRADTLYRPGFISKLYSDARRYSMLGTPYYETAKKDYNTVLSYINDWVPHVGIAGYMAYLDERRRAREERLREK